MVFYIGFSDVLSIAQTFGIIGTLLLIWYYNRIQIQNLSTDIETKVLSDLDEKVHRLNESMIEHPELSKVVTNLPSISLDQQFSFDVLNVWSHAYDMRERKVLNDNEWFGWLHWMRNAFKEGTIKEHWKQIHRNEWFDPAFEDFMNKEVIEPIEKGQNEKATTA
jgi:hypothetical protein